MRYDIGRKEANEKRNYEDDEGFYKDETYSKNEKHAYEIRYSMMLVKYNTPDVWIICKLSPDNGGYYSLEHTNNTAIYNVYPSDYQQLFRWQKPLENEIRIK